MAACNRNDEIIFWNLASATPTASSRRSLFRGPSVPWSSIRKTLSWSQPSSIIAKTRTSPGSSPGRSKTGGAKITPDRKHETAIDPDSKALYDVG